MASDGCRSCGADLPGTAAFCPRCGAAVDAVPILPLLGEGTQRPDDDGAEEPSRSGRTLVGVVIGIIVVLVALSTLSGGDEEGESAASTTSTTRPRPTTTTEPRSTTSLAPGVIPPLLADGTTLAGAAGLAMAVPIEGAVVLVDLGTGRQTVLPQPGGRRPETLRWTGEVLVAQAGSELYRLTPSDADPTGAVWEAVDVSGWRVEWLDRGGAMVLGVPDGSGVITFGYVGAEGPPVVLPIDDEVVLQSMFGGVGGWIDGRLIASTFDGIFALDPAGGAVRIAGGRMLGVGGGRVLRFGCDDRLVCGASIIETGTAGGVRERALPPLPTPGDYWMGGLSADGQRAWVLGYSQRGSVNVIHVYDGDGWISLDSSTIAPVIGPTYEWTDDGSSLVWIDPDRGEVTALAVAGDSSGVTTSVAFGTGDLVQSDAGWVGALAPISGLPAGVVGE